uniref:CWF21 domain-containing protein n=1 Tax=Plectus sambesii TaxID=2011161 RepID=A0A914WUD0_9BILA
MHERIVIRNMANIVEENAQLKRDLDTAKKQLTRIGLVHERLGQKSDELAMRYDDERRRSAKRKRTSSVSSVSPSSSRSGSSPSRSHSFGVEQYKDKLTIMNVELDNLKKRLLNKLTNLQDESNTAQAELKIERSKREICEKRRHHIIKMMACLLYQFGADHELLLSFAESCKNEDVTEIEQSQHAVALAEQATRTRREWQQMKAALNEHGTAFEAQRKEADEERDKLLTRLSTLEQESEDRQAALESLKDFRESTEKLRKVLDLTRVTREVDQPAPNNFKNLNAELDKAALSVGVRQLTKSVTNALYVIERNAIQVVTEQANKAYHKLQARLATVEAGVEAEKKRAADAQSALEVCVREKDEALQTAKTLKEAAETAERQKDKYKKVSDAIRLAAQETLRKIEQKPTSHERVKAIDDKFSERKEVREMVEEERMTTAEDQIGMFDHLAKASSSVRADDDFVIDDIFMSHKKKRKQTDDREERSKRDRHIADHKRHEQTLDSCNMCIDSTKLRKHLIVAVGLKTYLAVPSVQSLVEGHCLIVPMMHVPSSLQLDEDVFDEMKIWRKGLVAMLADRDEDCVFIESAKNVQHQPHMCIECIPLPKELGDAAPIYFKKAISECEGEWSDNKKLIDLASRGGDIRRAIPKGFSYFAVDFGLQSGYAHVIEDEQRFPANFAKEIVGGMMDLDHNLWRKPSVETFDEQTAKVVHFKDMWKSYDWTERVKQRLKDSDESDD